MTFKSKIVLQKSLQSLFERNGKINGEFYLDSLIDDAIKLGYGVKHFEVDSYISWGTPNDLRTFQYWQSCFHFWPGHPYKYTKDIWVDAEASMLLAEELKLTRPEIVAGVLVEK